MFPFESFKTQRFCQVLTKANHCQNGCQIIVRHQTWGTIWINNKTGSIFVNFQTMFKNLRLFGLFGWVCNIGMGYGENFPYFVQKLSLMVTPHDKKKIQKYYNINIQTQIQNQFWGRFFFCSFLDFQTFERFLVCGYKALMGTFWTL